MDEVERVRDVYAAYESDGRRAQWSADLGILDERRRLLASLLPGLGTPSELRVLDLGCGRGDLVAELVDLGVALPNVVGVDLLAGRLAEARQRGVAAALASGARLPFPDHIFDVVVAFTVLSSVGDDAVLRSIEAEARRVLVDGGALVIYDLRLPNPANRAVQPLPLHRLRHLFPGWSIQSDTCTLLPPLARRAAPGPGRRYDALVAVPPFRSHRLSILRPGSTSGFHLPPLPASPTVTVVMPIRNEARFIGKSLGAVLAQEGVAAPEVIVIDGHSDDDTPARVRQVAAAHGAAVSVVDNPGRIVPVSMNLGLARASGDVIVRVDGHCVIAPDYLRRCLDALARTGEACVGGPMETIGETSDALAIAAAQSSRFGVGGVAFRTSTEAAFVDTLAFGAYRREVFDQIGGFDEAFVRNQDDEFNLRLTRAGGRIWMDPTIRSTYFSRGTFAGLWRQYHGYGFYKVRVMRKHRTVPAVRHLVPAAFVVGTACSVALSVARRSPVPAALVIGPYVAGLASSSLTASTREARPARIALANATMHVAYGAGFLAGAARELVPGSRLTR